jgi:hypothetical protein
LPTAIGRLTATYLTLCALVLCAPSAAFAGADHYFDSTMGSGSGFSSGTAAASSYFTDGQADHNEFCSSWVAGFGGWYSAPANGTGPSQGYSCSASGGYASVSASGGLSGTFHGTVWSKYGFGSLIWDFTTTTHYSW